MAAVLQQLQTRESHRMDHLPPAQWLRLLLVVLPMRWDRCRCRCRCREMRTASGIRWEVERWRRTSPSTSLYLLSLSATAANVGSRSMRLVEGTTLLIDEKQTDGHFSFLIDLATFALLIERYEPHTRHNGGTEHLYNMQSNETKRGRKKESCDGRSKRKQCTLR